MRKIPFLSLAVLLAMPALLQAQDIPEYCLENDLTHSYLTEVQYDSEDYSYTEITNYYKVPTSYRKDQPKAVPLSWTKNANAVSQTIFVYDKTDSDTIMIQVNANVQKYDLYNLKPGRTYTYEIIGQDAQGQNITVKEASDFKTTGTVRMLKVDGVYNVRDLGGWTGLGGRKVPYGKLFRGGRLRNNSSNTVAVQQAGIDVLRAEGIRGEIDLRTDDEANRNNSSPLGSDVTYIRYNEAYACRIQTVCDNDVAVKSMQNIIDWLRQDKMSYFHCSVGADRTGTIAFLALALLGVDEDALSKDFELSSFYDNPEEEMLRMRTTDRYNYANMMTILKKLPGDNLQRKVYGYFQNGINGTKISTKDLDWYIKYMMDYKQVKTVRLDVIRLQDMEPGETHQLVAKITPTDATNCTPVYKSTNPKVVTVTQDGLVTAVRGGSANILVQVDDIVKTVNVTVPVVETAMPDSVFSGNSTFILKKNLITNGSFEYADNFSGWTSAKNVKMDMKNFDVVNYPDSHDCYIQSKSDGDNTSSASIRTMWKIEKGKQYILGYKVRNTSGKAVVKNPNLETSLMTLEEPSAEGTGDDYTWDAPARTIIRDIVSQDSRSMVFDYPSYDGNWTDIQYVFTNTEGYEYCQILFTHLSQDGDNTCFDEFYLSQVDEVTGVLTPVAECDGERMFNLSGQEISVPGKGIVIRNGKKYINQ